MLLTKRLEIAASRLDWKFPDNSKLDSDGESWRADSALRPDCPAMHNSFMPVKKWMPIR